MITVHGYSLPEYRGYQAAPRVSAFVRSIRSDVKTYVKAYGDALQIARKTTLANARFS
jgi:hypothetical protein